MVSDFVRDRIIEQMDSRYRARGFAPNKKWDYAL